MQAIQCTRASKTAALLKMHLSTGPRQLLSSKGTMLSTFNETRKIQSALLLVMSSMLTITPQTACCKSCLCRGTSQIQSHWYFWLLALAESQAINKAASASQDSSAETSSRYGHFDVSKQDHHCAVLLERNIVNIACLLQGIQSGCLMFHAHHNCCIHAAELCCLISMQPF